VKIDFSLAKPIMHTAMPSSWYAPLLSWASNMPIDARKRFPGIQSSTPSSAGLEIT